MNDYKKENRGYIVWSIVIGGIIGFLINIFSNLYYSIFITKNLNWNQIDHTHFVLCIAILIALVGYLGFFIYDYPNTFEFSKPYWKRYQNYFFHEFWPGKILRSIIGFYLIIFLIVLLIIMCFFLVQSFGYLYGIIILVSTFSLAYIKHKYFSN
jgi:hypothetical protein